MRAARIRVMRLGPERGIPLTCLQCHDAACSAVYPVTALVRDHATGAVTLLETRCVCCGLCLAACPFGNMVPEPDAPPAKCDLCGGTPRCVPFCPTAALEYLPMEAALQNAHAGHIQDLSSACIARASTPQVPAGTQQRCVRPAVNRTA